jgi:dTDP-4-amino-4,6-dideoxygalactose transaminase
MIPCSDPRAQYLAQKNEIDAAIAGVLASGTYILGNEVAAFESEFARYLGVRHAVAVANGTDAITLGLRALGITGGEVITSPLTAIASVAGIAAAGATAVLCDVSPDTLTLDPAAVERAITPKTRALMPVHLYGGAADLDRLGAIAQKHGVPLIEDCAQATGTRWRGRACGGFGDVGCFSFYPTKNLGALGDGGMAVTNDDGTAEKLRRLRQYGWDAQRSTREAGTNSRLDEMQAAVLRTKLPRLDADNERRRQIAARYDRGLAGLPLTMVATAPHATPVYHLYVVRLANRALNMAALEAHGVRAGIHYPRPAHREPGYAPHVRTAGALASAEEAADSVLSLPMYPQLSDADVDAVIAAMWNVLRPRAAA